MSISNNYKEPLEEQLEMWMQSELKEELQTRKDRIKSPERAAPSFIRCKSLHEQALMQYKSSLKSPRLN